VSTNYIEVFKTVLENYNHILMWPFTRRRYSPYNLLKPITRFYHFLNTGGVFVCWFVGVFLIGVVLTDEDDGEISAGLIVGLAFVTAIIASPLIILSTHLIRKLYIKNVRTTFQNAFLPKTFMPPKLKAIKLPKGFDLKKVADALRAREKSIRLLGTKSEGAENESLLTPLTTGRPLLPGKEEYADNDMEVTHQVQKDTPEVLDIVTSMKNTHIDNDGNIQISEAKKVVETEADDQDQDKDNMNTEAYLKTQDDFNTNKKEQQSMLTTGDIPAQYAQEHKKLKRKIKKELDKYRFGDIGLMDHEANKNYNVLSIGYFMFIVAMMTFIAGICCHLVYGFPEYAAKAAFIIVLASLFIELLITRPTYCLVMALIFY
jgi:hypothetical protein